MVLLYTKTEHKHDSMNSLIIYANMQLSDFPTVVASHEHAFNFFLAVQVIMLNMADS